MSLSAERNRRRRVEGNRVFYTGVLSAHDNAVLQCVASNDHGSILANAALKVIGLSTFSLPNFVNVHFASGFVSEHQCCAKYSNFILE